MTKTAYGTRNYGTYHCQLFTNAEKEWKKREEIRNRFQMKTNQATIEAVIIVLLENVNKQCKSEQQNKLVMSARVYLISNIAIAIAIDVAMDW